MKANILLSRGIICIAVSICFYCDILLAETIYVSSDQGNDTNPGTKDKPIQTIARAATIVNESNEPGPTTIKVAPGLYNLDQTVIFKNKRDYSENNRLILEAAILPDDPNWLPHLMPVIAVQQISKTSGGGMSGTETYSLKVKLNHVTIRGLKFLGNEVPNNFHNCIERVGSKLDDLLVTQCMFQGDKDGADIYAATLATGNRFVVDHCVFKDCGACVVFWDGLEGIVGQGCAMRYCIVDSAYMSGAWTCQTAEDFKFHNNVITNCEYFWMRKDGDRQQYKINNCVIIGNKYFSGYGSAAGPSGQTGEEVSFEENGIIKNGKVLFEDNKKSRNYMHIVEDSTGSEFGAGLFIQGKD
jgi:hypothetical protein